MSVMIAPVMSEKSAANLDKGLYVFAVSDQATKSSIVDEVKKLYEVAVVSVRIVNLPAKKVNFRRRPGQRSARRRAYIQLAKGQVIPGFELPKTDEKKGKDK